MRVFKRKQRRVLKEGFDFLPLFFWDKGLSDMAKVIMCVACGGKINRAKTLDKLKGAVPEHVVAEISKAVEELEFYGYISNHAYKGAYHEPRIDKMICPCPGNRLPKIIDPVPSAMPALHKTATDMYIDAARLGFIAETGKDTTYLLYSALRMLTGAESVMYPDELSILPHIGTESMRHGAKAEDLNAYPRAIVAVVITTHRVLFIQEDSDIEGRQNGLTRIISRPFSAIERVSIDETTGQISFVFFIDTESEDREETIVLDLLTVFALDNYPRYYNAIRTAISPQGTLPQLTRDRERRFT